MLLRFRTLKTIKFLGTGRTVKEANRCFFSGSSLYFQSKLVSDKEFGVKFSSVKLKSMIMIQNTLYFRNAICMVLHRKRILRLNQLQTWNLRNSKLKSRNMVQDTLYLEIIMYRMGHARSNIVSFFKEHQKFPG